MLCRSKTLLLVALTTVWFAFPARAIDVSFFAIEKVALLNQTSAAAPTYFTSNTFIFEALLISTNQYSVTNASFQPFGGSVRNLTNSDGYVWRYEQYFNDQNSMDTAFPTKVGLNSPTSYNFTIKSTNDGTHTVSLAFGTTTAAAGYTPIPQITNWTAAQSVDATLPFRLGWASLNTSTYPATSNDIVNVTLLVGTNVIWYSPSFGATNQLNGTNNYVIIPANTLTPGNTHTGHVTITHFVNTPATNYSFGVPAYTIDNQFLLKTRPTPTNLNLTFLDRTNQLVRLRFTGETNRTYTLEGTTNLITWTNLFSTNAPASGTNFTFLYTNNTTNLPQRIYRVRVGS